MDSRVYDRLAAAMSITFLLVLGGGTYYLASWANRDTSPVISHTNNVPNVFVEGVSLTRVSATGEPVFRMSAASMRHFPIDGSSEFLEPRLVSLDTSRPSVTVTAEKAVASSEGNETVLIGNVELRRQGTAGSDELSIKTERLTLVKNDEIAKTDAKVLIRQGNASLTGVGMEFDNLSRDFWLESQVRAFWPGSSSGPSSISNAQ